MAPKKTTAKPKRKPTAYNLFMKKEIPKVKREHPGLSHTEAFKKAAANWKKSKK